MAEKKGKLALP